MTIEAAIRTHLLTVTGLTNLVVARIYPGKLPQTPTLPAVVFTRISTAPVQDRSSATPVFSRGRWQFDCWATTYDGANALRLALRPALGGIAQASGPRIDVALMQDDRDIEEPETARWRAVLDYFIWYAEA